MFVPASGHGDATEARTSRSWQSIAKATERTFPTPAGNQEDVAAPALVQRRLVADAPDAGAGAGAEGDAALDGGADEAGQHGRGLAEGIGRRAGILGFAAKNHVKLLAETWWD